MSDLEAHKRWSGINIRIAPQGSGIYVTLNHFPMSLLVRNQARKCPGYTLRVAFVHILLNAVNATPQSQQHVAPEQWVLWVHRAKHEYGTVLRLPPGESTENPLSPSRHLSAGFFTGKQRHVMRNSSRRTQVPTRGNDGRFHTLSITLNPRERNDVSSKECRRRFSELYGILLFS